MIAQAIRDLRHAARAIARMPGMAAVVIGSLAVGIAANTIVFSWVQAVVFKPIPGVTIASRLHLVEAAHGRGVVSRACRGPSIATCASSCARWKGCSRSG